MNARVLRRAALALGLLAVLLVVALVGRLPGIGAEAVSARDLTVTAQPTSTPVERGPLTVPARAEGVRLTSLGVPTAALPTVAMLDGARNQDACTGVTVHLADTGSATNR